LNDKLEVIQMVLRQDESKRRTVEMDDPELLILRARRAYQRKGLSKRWIDQRLGSVGARQDLTGEWYRRGAQASEQFRELTNTLTAASFGLDVESFRRRKGLSGTNESLRDHMSDLELVLTTLGEATASLLHHERDTHSYEGLKRDVQEAGEVVAKARTEIETRLGHSVVQSDVDAT
jgi:hypothetical protein